MMTYDDRHIADSTTRLEIASDLVESACNSIKAFPELKAEAALCKAALSLVKDAYHAVGNVEHDRTSAPKDEEPADKGEEDIVSITVPRHTENPDGTHASMKDIDDPTRGKTNPTCPYGYGSSSVCGHCSKNGASMVTVFPSNPPQYNM